MLFNDHVYMILFHQMNARTFVRILITFLVVLGGLMLGGWESVSAETYNPWENEEFSTETEDIMQQNDPSFSLEEYREQLEQNDDSQENSISSDKTFRYILWGVVGLTGTALWVIMLFDAFKRKPREFPGTGTHIKEVWEIGVVLSWVIGALVYYVLVYQPSRKKVDKRHMMER